ncbi:putative oxidoreductase C663.06c [Araneus ventricosus]|uniref:Putative oxidoreductase C663.06c n=1 Tax=Araneus ventricosus TaxID=182803 RepID=A0A4Y2D089_ARAVE|nr:putative oxidoreductase C663.06c [Araneus ventricosus]
MKVENVMVTGANRGIGLEFVRQLSRLNEPPKHIFATYRSPDSLKDLKEIEESSTKTKIILIKMDVTNPDEREAARNAVEETVKERGLNLLINNAGVLESQNLPHLTSENLELHFKVNTVAPVMVSQTMLPLLERAAQLHGDTGALSVSKATVLNMASMTGSIANTGVIFRRDLVVPAYKMSKAALNMAMRIIATNVKDKGILVIMMCPGWVKTHMGTEKAVLEPEESISTMIKTLPKLNESHHGTFIDRTGNPYPY